MADPDRSRRWTLRLVGSGLVGTLAGCASSSLDRSSDPTDDAVTPDRTPTATDEPVTDETTASASPTAPELPPGKLVPEDGDDHDNFGSAVALTGDTALVAAMRDEDPNGTWAGSAYVFTRSDGTWTQQAKLVPDDGGTYDRFGSDVAVSGETALVGASDDGPNGEQSGSAYVFERTGGTWTQRTTLVPDDGDSRDHFGSAVSLSGDRAVIGAAVDEDPNGSGPKHGGGSAYVFERTDAGWSQQAKLAADDGDADDRFGDVVAQSGPRILVGASGDEDPNGRGSGAAYVFERSGGEWTQQAKLTPDDGDENDGFGEAVALSDDRAVVSAEYDEDPNGRDAGSVYVFERSGGEWTQQAKIADDEGGEGDQFGQAVALADRVVLVGSGAGEDFDAAHEGRESGNVGIGAVYAYHRSEGAWTHGDTLTAVDGDAGDLFGVAVAAHETTALVGAVGEEDPHGDGAGAAYVVELSE